MNNITFYNDSLNSNLPGIKEDTVMKYVYGAERELEVDMYPVDRKIPFVFHKKRELDVPHYI